MQWNADGVRSKVVELTKFIADKQPDVIAIQETKLRPQDTFRLQGFHVIRQDRTRGRRQDTQAGGGVAIAIREGIPFKRENKKYVAPNDDTTESVAVELNLGTRLRILNAYVPPIRRGDGSDDRVQRFRPSYWPTSDSTFILADVNSHCEIWDPRMPEDDLGRAIESWCTGACFLPANSGEATRQSRAAPYTQSTPDVSLHHVRWAGRVEWRVLTELSSNHLSIPVGQTAVKQS